MSISEKKVKEEIQEMKERLIQEAKDGLYDDKFLDITGLDDEQIWNEINCYDLEGIENLIYDNGFIAGLEMAFNYLRE
jgi:hypothetical protein